MKSILRKIWNRYVCFHDGYHAWIKTGELPGYDIVTCARCDKREVWAAPKTALAEYARRMTR